MKKQLLSFFAGLGSCFFVSAQTIPIADGLAVQFSVTPQYQGIMGLLVMAQEVIVRLVPILIGLAVLAFFWFIILFIWKGRDNPEVRKKMQIGILWSIIAIFVMVSIWGLVQFLGSVLGIQSGGSISGFKLPGE